MPGAARAPAERGGARPRAGLTQRAGASRTSARARLPARRLRSSPSLRLKRPKGGGEADTGGPRSPAVSVPAPGRPGRSLPLSAARRRGGRARAPSGGPERRSVGRAARRDPAADQPFLSAALVPPVLCLTLKTGVTFTVVESPLRTRRDAVLAGGQNAGNRHACCTMYTR